VLSTRFGAALVVMLAPCLADKLPHALVAAIQSDLEVSEAQACINEHQLTLEQMISTTRLSLDTHDGQSLFVWGLGPCFGGANNGPFLVYSRFGNKWRKIFDEIGNRLRPLRATSKGWHDLELQAHNSAFRSVRYVYRFDGRQYTAVRCNVVDHQLPKPVYGPCNWDWKR